MENADWVAAAQPDAIRASLQANAELIAHAGHAHGTGGMTSERTATYQGHQITVHTTYEITVDGAPFDVHLTVDNGGRVHYHGLPTRDFPSVIGLVEKAIDVFPADFPGPAGGQPEPEPDPGQDPHGMGHEHGGGH